MSDNLATALDRPYLDFSAEPAKTLPLAIPVRHSAIEIPTVPRRGLDVAEVLRCVAQSYLISVPLLMSRDRHRGTSEARHVAAWLMRQLGGLSYPEIGRAMGRDHTTIMHGIGVVLRRRESELRFEAFTDELARAVASRTGGAGK